MPLSMTCFMPTKPIYVATDACKTLTLVVEGAIQLMDEIVSKEICDARVSLPGYMVGTITRLLCDVSHYVLENEDERPSPSEVVMGMESWLVELFWRAHFWLKKSFFYLNF